MNAAFKMTDISAGPAEIFRAQVAEDLGGSLLLSDENELFEAGLAASCLLKPAAGDEVLCCRDGHGAFVLAVLTRAEPQNEAAVELPAKTWLKAGRLRLATQAVEGRTGELDLTAERFRLQGGLMSWNFRLVHLAVGLLSSVFKAARSRTKDCSLEVERTASVSAKRLKLKVQDDLTAGAGLVDLKAQGAVKIDGRTVSLG
ncbi:MAG: DUF3540 domain-containing protein [Deltaproteobacteria bacterium]|jgi:hypothetical protein|nr:DUF3540 domain-containing protein [Deltaproteobacteria bacterium]